MIMMVLTVPSNCISSHNYCIASSSQLKN